MKTLLLFFLSFITTSGLFAQQVRDSAALSNKVVRKHNLISGSRLDFSFGPVHGMYPNLRNIYPKGYYFVEGKGSATVLGLPFKLAFRQSDEVLRFGRASYFKLSFDPQTTRTQLIYKQVLSRNLRTSLKLNRDLFYLQNEQNSKRLIHQVSADAQLKLSNHFSLTGTYSILQLHERAVVISPRSDVSHLRRLGLASTHEIFKHTFTTFHDVSYVAINGFDSTQRLLQANAKYVYELKKLRLGMQVQYSDFSGLTRLYGINLVVQPEVAMGTGKFFFQHGIPTLERPV